MKEFPRMVYSAESKPDNTKVFGYDSFCKTVDNKEELAAAKKDGYTTNHDSPEPVKKATKKATKKAV